MLRSRTTCYGSTEPQGTSLAIFGGSRFQRGAPAAEDDYFLSTIALNRPGSSIRTSLCLRPAKAREPGEGDPERRKPLHF